MIYSVATFKTIQEKKIDPDLLDYNDWKISAYMTYPCSSCNEDSEIFCEPEEFDPEFHYCGKTQWCLP